MAKWTFRCRDNGGKRQFFTVAAPDKTEAEKKAFKRANKAAKGEIISWECRLNTMF